MYDVDVYENQGISDWLESLRDPLVNYFGGRRLVLAETNGPVSNQIHARCRKLTLELRRRYPSDEKIYGDTINSDSALSVFVAGAWRHVIDHRTFLDRHIEYMSLGYVARVPISKVRYNREYGSINVNLFGFRNKEFNISKFYFLVHGKQHVDIALRQYDYVFLKHGKVVDIGYQRTLLGGVSDLF